jgi:hypothetical protein
VTSEDSLSRLSAGLDRDEQLAQAPEGWTAQGADMHGMSRVTVDHSVEFVVACTLAWRGEHLARHDPARALRQADAFRRVLERHAEAERDSVLSERDAGFGAGLYAALECLASIYTDEPAETEKL